MSFTTPSFLLLTKLGVDKIILPVQLITNFLAGLGSFKPFRFFVGIFPMPVAKSDF
jgi:hypothetical protein